MFEPGHDQAAGLRAHRATGGAALMPVAAPAQPARVYETLCTLALQLGALGREPVILDASAHEAAHRPRHGGAPLGLLNALQDASVAHLGRPTDGSDWLVMPAADGLASLQQTARAAGARVALSRLLAPFSSRALVLLFAPATALAGLLAGLDARALVPVIGQAQSSLDAYGAVKLLTGAGLTPVLAPLAQPHDATPQTLVQVVDSVADCALRHLDHRVEVWPVQAWGQGVTESALPCPRLVPEHALRWQDDPTDTGWAQPTAATYWS